jgi:anti-sigma factor RsiW
MSAGARFEELANTALDGVATPAERAELEGLIARDPEARERWNSLKATFVALGSLTPPEPPADLKPAIMRAIRAESEARSSAAVRPAQWWFRWATTFAAGAAAGILVVTLAGPRAARDLPSSGTMMPPTAGQTIARTALDAGSAHVEIETRNRAGDLEVHVRGRASSQAELVIDHGAALQPAGVDGLNGSTHQIAMTPGRTTLMFANELGCAIRFKGSDAGSGVIRLTLRSETRTAEGTVRVVP